MIDSHVFVSVIKFNDISETTVCLVDAFGGGCRKCTVYQRKDEETSVCSSWLIIDRRIDNDFHSHKGN